MEQNCPCGVIQMAPGSEPPRAPSLISQLLFGNKSKQAEAIENAGQKKAVKCDMCKGLAGGAACVRACPTGAAIRVSPDHFSEYTGS